MNRILSILVISEFALLAWFIRNFPPTWIQSKWLTITIASLLSVYLAGCLYGLNAPARHPDPYRKIGLGCLWILVATLITLGALLAVGVHYQVPWLMKGLFYLTVFPALMFIPSLTAEWIKYRRSKQTRA